MIFPSWTIFMELITEFKKEINNKIQLTKSYSHALNESISSTFSILPPPFNAVAEKIYKDENETAEKRLIVVLEYFEDVLRLGQEH
jgi:hypothetical protein